MSDSILSKSTRMLNVPILSHLEHLEEKQKTITTHKLQTFIAVVRDECREAAIVLRKAWDQIKQLQAENEALRARVAELESAMRSVNRLKHHAITVLGDDEPCYWQRKNWVDWIFFLGSGGSDEVRGG